MQHLVAPLIHKIGISGSRASLVEMLAVMASTTAAVFLILKIMKYHKARE